MATAPWAQLSRAGRGHVPR